MATFSVGITTQDALIATAQAANNGRHAGGDRTRLYRAGRSEEDLQTDHGIPSIRCTIIPTSTPAVNGIRGQQYRSRSSSAVLDQRPTLLDAAVEAGANTVYSLVFQSSEQNAAYDQALKAAAQDALRKAALMAQAIGGKPATLSLSENVSAERSYCRDTRAYALDSSYAVRPSKTALITVTVTAVVELK